MGQLRPAGLSLLQPVPTSDRGFRSVDRQGRSPAHHNSKPACAIGPKTKQQPPRQSHSLQLGLMPHVHKLLAVGLSRQLERGWWYTAPGVLRQRVVEFRRHAFALTAIHLCSRRPYNVGSLIDRPVCGEFPPPAFWRGFNFRSRFSRFPTTLPHWPQWNN